MNSSVEQARVDAAFYAASLRRDTRYDPCYWCGVPIDRDEPRKCCLEAMIAVG